MNQALTPADTPTVTVSTAVLFAVTRGVHVVLVGHLISVSMFPLNMKSAQTPTQTPEKSDAAARPAVTSARMAKVLSAKGCMVYRFCRVSWVVVEVC